MFSPEPLCPVHYQDAADKLYQRVDSSFINIFKIKMMHLEQLEDEMSIHPRKCAIHM